MPPTAMRPEGQFSSAVTAELLKARLHAAGWAQVMVGVAVLSAMVAFMMGRASAAMAQRGDATASLVFRQPDVVTMGWTKVGLLGLLVWAAASVLHEVGATLPQSWLAVPSRARLLGAKVALACVVAMCATLLVMPALLLVAQVGGAEVGVTRAALLMIGKSALGLGVLAAFSIGLAALTRSRAFILVWWGLMLLSDETIGQVVLLHPLGWFMPMTNLWHLSGVRVFETVTPPWPPVISLGWLLLLASAACWFGARRLRRFPDSH